MRKMQLCYYDLNILLNACLRLLYFFQMLLLVLSMHFTLDVSHNWIETQNKTKQKITKTSLSFDDEKQPVSILQPCEK